MQLHRAREQFEQAGVDLVLIGQATPRQADALPPQARPRPLPILADEERQTYKIAGFKQANARPAPRPAVGAVSGVKHGARSGVVQGRIIGDAAQLGGAMVIAPGGEVVFRQASKNAGDTIEPADLLARRSAA